jgi:steroid 5-alpha reductase family enzyme
LGMRIDRSPRRPLRQSIRKRPRTLVRSAMVEMDRPAPVWPTSRIAPTTRSCVTWTAPSRRANKRVALVSCCFVMSHWSSGTDARPLESRHTRAGTSQMETPKPFLVVLVVVLCAALGAGVAWLAGGPTLLLGAAIAFGIQWVAFVPSSALKTERYYDLTGSLTYLTLMAWSLCVASHVGARQALVTAAVGIWALRLGTFLFRRIRRDGRDGRFDAIKQSASRFFLAWTLQGLWVFLTALAALIVNIDAGAAPLGATDIVGMAVWVFGFAIEVIADRQKSAFRARPETAGAWIDEGLWSHSRHPNYLGEILLWTGIFIVGAGQFEGWQWLGVLSPVFVTVLLTRVSGIPMLETRADERWGDDPAYQTYKKRVPALVPQPWR